MLKFQIFSGVLEIPVFFCCFFVVVFFFVVFFWGGVVGGGWVNGRCWA